jgi:hypothetical protein
LFTVRLAGVEGGVDGAVWCGWEVIWRFRTGVKGVVWNGALGASEVVGDVI